jgi:hypothetical protein
MDVSAGDACSTEGSMGRPARAPLARPAFANRSGGGGSIAAAAGEAADSMCHWSGCKLAVWMPNFGSRRYTLVSPPEIGGAGCGGGRGGHGPAAMAASLCTGG